MSIFLQGPVFTRWLSGDARHIATTSVANAFFPHTKSCGDAKCAGLERRSVKISREGTGREGPGRPVDSILYIVFSSAAPLDERGVDSHWILGPSLVPPFGVLNYPSIARVDTRLFKDDVKPALLSYLSEEVIFNPGHEESADSGFPVAARGGN